jgi:diguanylate cyclase (GGDEF)-like protein/PAS domain S-box-containing protein
MIGERDLSQLDEVLARSPLALVAFDTAFHISYWSARAQRMFGYSAGDVLGKRLDETTLVHTDDLREVLAVQRSLNDGNTALVMTYRNLRSDGEIRHCRWTTVSVQEDDTYHAVCFAEDITGTLEAREALVESEQRFRSLFDYNPELIVFFAPDGSIVDVNAAVAHFGPHVTPELVIGRSFTEWMHPEDIPMYEAYLRRALAGETLFFHARAQSLTGRPLELAITSVPMMRNGVIEGVFSIVRDETAKREAERQISRQEQELADSEARLRSLFLHNPDPVVALDLDGVMTDCNDAAVQLSGLSRENIVGSPYTQYLGHATGLRVQAAFGVASAGKPVTMTFETVNGRGRPIEVNSTIIPQYSHDEVVGIYAIFQDITARRIAERRAEGQRQRIRDLYFIAASGDRSDLRIVASLEMGARAFGLNEGAVIETTGDTARIADLYRSPGAPKLPDSELIAIAQAVAHSAAGTPVVSPRSVALRIDLAGEPYGALVFASPSGTRPEFVDTDADLLGLISTLIAGAIESERSRAKLRTLAYYDALTGLPNRTYLGEKVRDAIEVAQSRLSGLALLFLDLDGFKDVNDTLGHARGDQLLRMVSQRLTQAVGNRSSVARMGGDEFVVLMTGCSDVGQARDLAEQLIAVISEPFALDEYEQYISVSVGIAMYPEDGRDEQTLIKNADIAMSRAKDRGRNGYYCYDPTLEAPIHMRLSQEKLLRRALELDEFVVFYQPQLDLRNGRVVSVEALVRWNHPKSGLIEPGHFIPSAEISGLIVPLGDWVLETSARQIKEWHSTLGPLRLAVNLSARQFHHRDLRIRVLRGLSDAGLLPEFLEVEITESVAMSDAAQAAEIIRDLASNGIRIAVDDFGTGYSSLAYLRQFNLDVLKVDGSFVKGIGRTAGDETLINTIIGMAHSLDLEVIAEGVETLEQLAFLSAKGCDVVQGWAIAPALPAADLEAFVLSRNESTATGYRA